MILGPRDRKYAYTNFVFYDLSLDAVLDVALADNSTDWVPMTIVVPGRKGAVLVAAPGASGNPDGTIVLPAHMTTHLSVRVIDGGEQFYLSWGPFTVR